MQFTAVFQQAPEGYTGFVEELPGANTQGGTLDEARANLREAVTLVLEANPEIVDRAWSGPMYCVNPCSSRCEAARSDPQPGGKRLPPAS